jgi:hypothetical protein
VAAAAAGALAAVAVALIGDDEDDSGDPGAALRALPGVEVALGEAAEPSAALRPPLYAIATVRDGASVALRRSPGGPAIETIGDATEFGSARSFWVARVSGDWLGVPAPEAGNGELAWIRDDRDRLDLFQSRYSLHADLSDRILLLRYGNRVIDRIPVTVGGAGTPTPTGNYAVTDALAGARLGPWYGCCVLALTGHQPNLPPGWIGGDRIAIHGTPGAVGGAGSSGCLRAADADMVGLFARVPLGTPVFVRA